jgi:hypothetical protein
MKISFSIPSRFLKAAALFASKDATRFVLGGVSLEISEDHATAVLAATDGRRFFGLNVRGEFASFEAETGAHRIILPAPLIAMAPRDRGGVESVFEIEHNKATLRGAKGEWVRADLIEGNYPKWREVIPGNEATPQRFFNLNAGLLADFATADKMLGGDGVISMQSNAETHPITLRGTSPKSGEWLGVIMPCRTDTNRPLPFWV